MLDSTYQKHSRVEGEEINKAHGKSSYGRFLAMVGTSTAIMFGLMYLISYSLEHIYWSETRFYMTFVMGATMAVVMLLFMWGMYKNMAANVAILAGSAVMSASADTTRYVSTLYRRSAAMMIRPTSPSSRSQCVSSPCRSSRISKAFPRCS